MFEGLMFLGWKLGEFISGEKAGGEMNRCGR